LTKPAGKIATDTAERQDFRAGIKMIERLLFDGINSEARRFAVGKRSDVAILTRPDTAGSPLPFGKSTVIRTKIALCHI
jgi:hypothetical protein